MTVRIALAEDRSFLAQAIAKKISLFPDELELLFHAPNGQEMVDRLAEGIAVDAILMDIEMPVLDGIEATRLVAERHPHIKVIMFTVFDDEQRIFQAIEAGAMGYLLKDESAEVLRDSILMIMEGGAPMSPPIAAKALQLLRDPQRAQNSGATEDFQLTKREIDVLEQLSQGLEYQEIASNLFIAPATVRKHIENIYRKLQVNNKVRAVRKATQHGLI